jgi:hypothetical protein
MRQWAFFILKTASPDAGKKAATLIAARPALYRWVKKPELRITRDGRQRLTALEVGRFDSGEDEWNWFAEHPALAGELAAEVGCPAYTVLCLNGAAYEEWVFAYDRAGALAWEAREGDDGPNLPRLHTLRGEALRRAEAQTPFGRLHGELKVWVQRWFATRIEDGPPSTTISLAPPRPPPAPSAKDAGKKVVRAVEIPAAADASKSRLVSSWMKTARALDAMQSRVELLQRVPQLPIIGPRITVELEVGDAHWKRIEASASRLNVDPGRLLAAAALLAEKR